MRRLALVALVVFAAACSGKKEGSGGGGSAAGGPAPVGSGTATAASGSAAGATAADAPPPPDAPAVPAVDTTATATTVVTDDGVADHGAGHDGRGLYYARALTAADLDRRTLRDLALMRNTIYARAGHQFRKAWLRGYFTAQPWYRPLDQDDDARITATDRANAKLIAARESAFPRDQLVAAQAALAARTTRTVVEDIELRLLGEQLGKAAPVAADTPAAAPRSPLEDPSQLDRLLTVDELADLSRRDLRILRNTVYARHGRVFKSPLLQDWFDNKDWYRPDPGFAESSLSSIDQKNVRLIRSVEDSLGGPLTDREQQADDGWWDAA